MTLSVASGRIAAMTWSAPEVSQEPRVGTGSEPGAHVDGVPGAAAAALDFVPFAH